MCVCGGGGGEGDWVLMSSIEYQNLMFNFRKNE